MMVQRTCTSGLAAVLAAALAGCSPDGLLKGDELPPEVVDPTITRTPQGALAAYRGAIDRKSVV